uniref:Uncharacterized protein n=1 Tax=Haptolina brevifila TaxID=156173 RepID=A0A7S2DME1_9EUKA|mmetsp:Transcript_40010/g.80217  ORF Transcript_40010/g.80217 Transcript_40010/m.80217 type:complete len:447 (+) Transcript_40010:72-1412(+)|eukprot:CAMPEP_0174714194 /NCGR_PEP_ID=MMETSP1094-20130205/17068_1 /TAXON_ID=156173 /ORGANISM="Chrysochromulina brevifilum, Strain UTEX LB 985" /LENGTH=446 /DNA_ID=CAMNT_0015913499 /DNA_START=66 /DNA_END=1406 /DNA_ORIENTATION=+
MSYAGGSGNAGVITRTTPANMSRKNPNYQETHHKALTESPLPYRQEDPSEADTRYCDEVHGIIPGYAGHRPRAQHNYGRSAFGDPEHVSHAAELRKKGHLVLTGGVAHFEDAPGAGHGGEGKGIDGKQTGHPNTKDEHGRWMEGLPDYSHQVGGVLPGYGGHVPRSIHKYGASAKGQTPPFEKSREHDEIKELRELFSRQPKIRGLEKGDFPRSDPNDDGEEWWPQTAPTAAIEGQMKDFRDVRNGVVPKYAGHIPRSKDKYGASAFGRTRTVADVGQMKDTSNSGVKTEGVIMGQVNRQNTKAEVEFKPAQRHDGNGVIPGYRGHVPNVVNTIGMSTFLSGPGFTEVKVEDMDKMGGLGDLGDAASAYGMVDAGASSFDDGYADMDNLGGNVLGSDAIEQAGMAGHIDQYTFGDASADAAEAAKAANAEKLRKHQEAKLRAQGLL